MKRYNKEMKKEMNKIIELMHSNFIFFNEKDSNKTKNNEFCCEKFKEALKNDYLDGYLKNTCLQKYESEYCDGYDEGSYKYLEINYCPFCGRKLEKNKE